MPNGLRPDSNANCCNAERLCNFDNVDACGNFVSNVWFDKPSLWSIANVIAHGDEYAVAI